MTIFNQSMLSILVYVYNISSRINIFRPHCSGPLCLCVYLKFNLKSKLVCRDKLASKRLWPKKFCQKAFCNFSDKIRFWRIQRFPERRCPEKRSSLKAKLNRPFINFFKKMGQSRPLLSFIFGLFDQTSLQFLQQIYVKKCPSCIWCQDLNPFGHESPPITTRPGLPPILSHL